jgi:hypothetical protein
VSISKLPVDRQTERFDCHCKLVSTQLRAAVSTEHQHFRGGNHKRAILG